MPRLAHLGLVVALLALAPVASAQSHLVRAPGLVAGVDVVGGPFPATSAAGVDVSGALGWRLGNGLDVSALVGYGGPVDDLIFPYAPEVHLGAEAAFAFGREAGPWRIAVSGRAATAAANAYAFSGDLGSGARRGERRGGREWVEVWGGASASRFVRLVDGPERVAVGVGAFVHVHRVAPTTLIFDEGTADERVARGDVRTERLTGVLVSLPVAVEVGGATVVLDSQLRASLIQFIPYGISDGAVTLRVNL